MSDITTVAARIAAVEAEVAEFAAAVREKRDALTAELTGHHDAHAAEVAVAKSLLARISPAAPAASQHVFLTKQPSWLLSNWRAIVIGLSVLIVVIYYFTEGRT